MKTKQPTKANRPCCYFCKESGVLLLRVPIFREGGKLENFDVCREHCLSYFNTVKNFLGSTQIPIEKKHSKRGTRK